MQCSEIGIRKQDRPQRTADALCRIFASVLLVLPLQAFIPAFTFVREVELQHPTERPSQSEEHESHGMTIEPRARRFAVYVPSHALSVEAPPPCPKWPVTSLPTGHRYSNGLVAPLRC